MIHHTGLHVSDFEKSKLFYTVILKEVGYILQAEYPGAAGFFHKDGSAIWIGKDKEATRNMHVAIAVSSEDAIKSFYDTATTHGGEPNGAPGPRPHYGPDYYGCFVKDFDGNNIEAVLHKK